MTDDYVPWIIFWTLIAFFLATYFLPTIVATLRSHRNSAAIFALNLFAGWTLAGWVVAIVWACLADVRCPRV